MGATTGSDEHTLRIHKNTRARILNLAVVSKAKDEWFKQLTERSCSDFGDTCFIAFGNEADNGL